MSLSFVRSSSVGRSTSSEQGTIRSVVSWDHNVVHTNNSTGNNSNPNSIHTRSVGTVGSNRNLMSPKTSTHFHVNSVDYHLHHPISAGFLLKFCEAQYCSENMRFITEVDRFREHFYRDRQAWPKVVMTGAATSGGGVGITSDPCSPRSVCSAGGGPAGGPAQCSWKQLDAELALIENDTDQDCFLGSHVDNEQDFIRSFQSDKEFIRLDKWPSKIVNRESIRESLIMIWNTFLTKDSLYWICIPYSVLVNTMRRIRRIDLYGPDVFGEMLLDPIKTIQRDIYPRFLQSEDFRMMKRSLVSLESSPCANQLKLSKPAIVIFDRYRIQDIENGQVRFSLQDVIDDGILHIEFMKYLESIVACENLYCIRAIAIFKEAIGSSKFVSKDQLKTQQQQVNGQDSHQIKTLNKTSHSLILVGSGSSGGIASIHGSNSSDKIINKSPTRMRHMVIGPASQSAVPHLNHSMHRMNTSASNNNNNNAVTSFRSTYSSSSATNYLMSFGNTAIHPSSSPSPQVINTNAHTNTDTSTMTNNAVILTSSSSPYDIAWSIYKFFLTANADYEISCNYQLKNEIMRTLANPTLNMFDAIEQSVWNQLKIHFQQYVNAVDYSKLPTLVSSVYHKTWLPQQKQEEAKRREREKERDREVMRSENDVREKKKMWIWSTGKVNVKKRVKNDDNEINNTMTSVDAVIVAKVERKPTAASAALSFPRLLFQCHQQRYGDDGDLSLQRKNEDIKERDDSCLPFVFNK